MQPSHARLLERPLQCRRRAHAVFAAARPSDPVRPPIPKAQRAVVEVLVRSHLLAFVD